MVVTAGGTIITRLFLIVFMRARAQPDNAKTVLGLGNSLPSAHARFLADCYYAEASFRADGYVVNKPMQWNGSQRLQASRIKSWACHNLSFLCVSECHQVRKQFSDQVVSMQHSYLPQS